MRLVGWLLEQADQLHMYCRTLLLGLLSYLIYLISLRVLYQLLSLCMWSVDWPLVLVLRQPVSARVVRCWVKSRNERNPRR